MIAQNKKRKERVDVVSLLSFTNMNVLPFADEIPVEIISFLDPTVEKLYFDKAEGNKEIVSTLIRFFMDTRLNKNGGL